MKKTMTIGIEDFKTLIDDNCYYVDKTSFITELLTNAFNGVKLILRSRRFGKTLMHSTLRYFFDIDEKENAYLFKDLAISKETKLCGKYQNKYPVISFTLKDVKGRTEEEFIKSFNKQLNSEYRRHRYIESFNKILLGFHFLRL